MLRPGVVPRVPAVLSGYAMGSFLESRGIYRRDVKRFVLTQAYRLKDHACQPAAREGRPYQYFGETDAQGGSRPPAG
jgi:hypothetical protein